MTDECPHELALTGYQPGEGQTRVMTLACKLCDHQRNVITDRSAAELEAIIEQQEQEQTA